MGIFYVSFTLLGPSQREVAAVLGGRSAWVSPERNGCVVVCDQEADAQDTEVIAELAGRLSEEFQCPLLAVMNHDDSMLWYQLHLNGGLLDEYNSSPDYFDSDSEEPATLSGGNAELLRGVFGRGDLAKLEKILRKSPDDGGDFIFESERHAELCEALGLPEFAVGFCEEYFGEDDFPPGLDKAAMIETKKLPPLDESARALNCSPGYYKVRLPSNESGVQSRKFVPAAWMPSIGADLECSKNELSPACLSAMASARKQFQELGFREVGFKKLGRTLVPGHRDNGGINFLDAANNQFGQIIYLRHYLAGKKVENEHVTIAFTFAFENGIISSTNNLADPLGSLPDHHVIRIDTDDVKTIYEPFLQQLRQRANAVRAFADVESLKAWFDSNQLKSLEDRVRRRVLVRMTDYEVKLARDKLPLEHPEASNFKQP